MMNSSQTVKHNSKQQKNHSEKLKSNLEKVAKDLQSRPIELRGPFKSGLNPNLQAATAK